MMFPAIFFGIAVVHAILAIARSIRGNNWWSVFSALNGGLFVALAVLNIA